MTVGIAFAFPIGGDTCTIWLSSDRGVSTNTKAWAIIAALVTLFLGDAVDVKVVVCFDIGTIGYIKVTAIDIDVAVFTTTCGDKA